VLADRKLALGSMKLGRTEVPPYDVSMVFQGHDVVFVSWTDPSNLVGRRCRIEYVVDGDDLEVGFVVYPTGVGATSFRDALVVHPGLGEHVRRSRNDRTQLPPKALRLKSMWEASGCKFGSECIVQCVACDGPIDAIEADIDDAGAQDDEDQEWAESSVCCVCCCSLHSKCARHLCAVVDLEDRTRLVS
jgi:hypothetical protein